MKFIVRRLNLKLNVAVYPVYLIEALIAISFFLRRTEAMFVPSAPQKDSVSATQMPGNRAIDMAMIQRVLESKVVRQKLMELALSSVEVTASIDKLSDEQVHHFAFHPNSIRPRREGGVVDQL